MRALEFIRDHVNSKLPYDFSYHMKKPMKKPFVSKYIGEIWRFEHARLPLGHEL